MLGPLLPLLAARWSLNDTQSGYLISAQFLGALAGTICSGFLLPRVGFRKCMGMGTLLMALGTGILMSGGVVLAMIAIFCYGAGIGLTIPAGNLAVAATSAERRSANLSLLNFSWSAGAVSCPFLLAFLEKVGGAGLFVGAVALVFVAMAVVAFATRDEAPPPISNLAEADRSRWHNLRSPAAILVGTLFFVYVGTENALGAWLSSYAKRLSDSPASVWMLVSSYFYGSLLAGRALAPFTFQHLSETWQACIGATLALLSSIVLVLSRSMTAVAVCAFVAGLGLSTLYPITISLLSSSFGERAKSIGGFMFALSTLGGASVPWLVGFVSAELRSLRAGLVVPLVGCAIMLAVFSSSQWKLIRARTFPQVAGG